MNESTTPQKLGLGLAGLLCATSVLSVLLPRPDGVDSPPTTIVVIVSLLSALGLAAVILASRSGRRQAIRVAAGSLILIQLTAVPALFVDTPAAIKVWIGASMLLSMFSIVLMFSVAQRPADVHQ